jgi:hypothetical protein
MSSGGKFTVTVVLAALALGVVWPIASAELAKNELSEDLRDIAADKAARIGLTVPNSDDDIRNEVIRAAKHYDIDLAPEEITVQDTGTPDVPRLYVAADYNARVRPLGVPVVLHFSISSAR